MARVVSFLICGLAVLVVGPLSSEACAFPELTESQLAPAPREAAQDSVPARERDAPPPLPKTLPAAVTTSHAIDLPGRILRFRATAGAIPLKDAQTGALEAEVAFVAFVLDDKPPQGRPITFVVNGGPGAGSAWLDLGALGPWRLPLEGLSPSPSARRQTIDNADTWLDFTDLVFIDPPGTGYSRLSGRTEESRRRFFSVDGDIDALAVVIRKWLMAYRRLSSPVFIVGESYGGFRAPKLARRLQDREGIGVKGLVLVSPVLDFGWFEGVNNPLPFVARLPSQAAAARNFDSADGRSGLVDVETYAVGGYLADLLRGERDAVALDRLAENVARFTGIDKALVRKLGGRVDAATFSRERGSAAGKVTSIYDTRVSGFDAAPLTVSGDYSDPLLDVVKTPLAGAMADTIVNRLGWLVEDRYEILNESVNRRWDWGSGRGRAESLSDLKRAMATDPDLGILVTHGLTDLVTPYFATKLLLDQVPPLGSPGRLRFKVYGGGHMFYFDRGARASLREDARRLIVGE